MEPNPRESEFCRIHPTVRRLPRRDYCTLDEDWSSGVSWTPKDKRYEFTTGTHVEIRTKGGWEHYLRSRNLVELPVKENLALSTGGYRQRKQRERMARLKQELTPVLGRALQASRG